MHDHHNTKPPARIRRPPWPAWLAVVVNATCGDRSSPDSLPFVAEPSDIMAFSEAFEVVDTLVLEENDSVLTVSPSVAFDGQHFLVSDPHAFQARIYAKDGELLWARGRQGQGPGEFMAPASVRIMSDGRIAVLDPLLARITYFERDASIEPVVGTLPFVVDDVIGINDELRLLVIGGTTAFAATEGGNPWLHLWNANLGKVESSFFSNPFPPHMAIAARTVAKVEIAVLGDTIWAAHALSDSLYAFTLDGSPARSIPLPIRRQIKSEELPMELPWSIGRFYFVEDRDIAMPLWRVKIEVKDGKRTLTRGRERALMVIDREGNPTAFLSNTPKLYAVVDDLFYFQNPDRIKLSQWIVARHRSPP